MSKTPTSRLTRQKGPRKASLLAQLEIPRKVFHSAVGLIACYIYFNNWSLFQTKTFVLTLTAICFLIEIFRLKVPALNRFMFWLMGSLSRSKELTQFTGSLYYFLGIDFAVFCLPKDLAFLCILYVAWCDPMASLLGRLAGRFTPRFPNKKSVAGLIGAFVTAFLITKTFYLRFAREISYCQPAFSLTQWALVSGVVVAIAEVVDVNGIDDNLAIPLLSGSILFLVSKLACLYLGKH